jgi:REP-associated tyrosine transposase
MIPDGATVHLMRRGNNRGSIFVDDYDRELFLAILEAKARHHGVPIHGLVLMTNHYHAIATPPTQRSLELTMRDLGRQYVLSYNRRHGRIGTLWTGRYKAIPIHDDRYLLTCLRYIEQNPLRAGLAVDADDYRWSSYRCHAHGESCEWLTPHHVYLALGATDGERQNAYTGLFRENLVDGELVRQRMALSPTSSLALAPFAAVG